MTTIAPVDYISGCFGKRKASVCKKTVIANVRRAESSFNGGTPYQFFTVRQNDRSTPFSQAELAYQTRFGKICKGTSARLKDPQHIAADQAAFKAQTQYKTLRQYVWREVAKTIE